MKTLRNLPVPQDTDTSKWPFGQIKNETETEPGTPVVREVYGDILSNVYAILKDAGITPNEDEDSEASGYQLLQAFKKFVNELNDIEQVVSLTGTNWQLPINIDKLPNKYVLFARMGEAYVSTETYSISGTGNNSYTMVSPTGFNSGDEVLIVLDQSEVRVYAFGKSATNVGGVFPSFGNPLAFNDSETLYYQSDGYLLSDEPSAHNLQNQIRIDSGDATLYVNDIFILNNTVVCVCFDTSAETYRLFEFDINDLETATEITITGKSIPTGTDNSPYFFTDGEYIYITNASGNSANDYELDKFILDGDLSFVSSVSLDETFTKTTNSVIDQNRLFTFSEGVLERFNLSTGAKTFVGQFNTMAGVIFSLAGAVYYTNGEVAKQWTL